jgi:hypothetical protein
MTKSDWIGNVVAIIGLVISGVLLAITAFAAITGFASRRRQTRLLLPVVRCSAQRLGEYAALYASLESGISSPESGYYALCAPASSRPIGGKIPLVNRCRYPHVNGTVRDPSMARP